MAVDRTTTCAMLAFLGGSIFGYVLIGISSAALTIWRCYYGLGSHPSVVHTKHVLYISLCLCYRVSTFAQFFSVHTHFPTFPAARNSENQWWIGALFAVINIGGLPYGLVAGNVMEKFGRKKTVTGGGAVIFVGTFLSAVAPTYSTQACARVLTGVGVGMIMSSVPVYIAEMAPPERRGTLQALFQVCVTLQILAGNVAGYYILGVYVCTYSK